MNEQAESMLLMDYRDLGEMILQMYRVPVPVKSLEIAVDSVLKTIKERIALAQSGKELPPRDSTALGRIVRRMAEGHKSLSDAANE